MYFQLLQRGKEGTKANGCSRSRSPASDAGLVLCTPLTAAKLVTMSHRSKGASLQAASQDHAVPGLRHPKVLPG